MAKIFAPPTLVTLACLLTQLGEKLPQDAHEVAEGEAMVSHNALNLVELSQMCGIQCLISEYTVNGEVLGGCKGLLGVTEGPGPEVGQKAGWYDPPPPPPAQAEAHFLSQTVEGTGTRRRGVRA